MHSAEFRALSDPRSYVRMPRQSRRAAWSGKGPGRPVNVAETQCNVTLRQRRLSLSIVGGQASDVELTKHAVWPSGTSVRRPYSPHYIFASHLSIFNSWLQYYVAWHPGAVFLDIGSRSKVSLRQLPALKHFEYHALERDQRRAAKGSLVCDLFECAVGRCSADVVYSRYVLEHLESADRGLAAMASFVKQGGLLITVLPWTSRYHAEDSYGHYTQLSARALERMCIGNGLNPVRSGYDDRAQRGDNKDGVRTSNVLDRTPYLWPGTSEFNSFVICYKPRRGERRVTFEEVGQLPAELHPRFELRFDLPGSEAPGLYASGVSLTVRARLLQPGASLRDAAACHGLAAGELAILLAEPALGLTKQALERPQVVRLHHGTYGAGRASYVGPMPRVHLDDRKSYRVASVGRC